MSLTANILPLKGSLDLIPGIQSNDDCCNGVTIEHDEVPSSELTRSPCTSDQMSREQRLPANQHSAYVMDDRSHGTISSNEIMHSGINAYRTRTPPKRKRQTQVDSDLTPPSTPSETHRYSPNDVTSEAQWEEIVREYLQKAKGPLVKKTLLTSAQLHEIRMMLQYPDIDDFSETWPRQFDNCRDRRWVAETFRLGSDGQVINRDPKAGRTRGVSKEERSRIRQTMIDSGILPIEEQIVPREDIHARLVTAHLSCGHGGRDTTFERMKATGFMPPTKELIKAFCAACPTCQGRTPRRNPQRMTQDILTPPYWPAPNVCSANIMTTLSSAPQYSRAGNEATFGPLLETHDGFGEDKSIYIIPQEPLVAPLHPLLQVAASTLTDQLPSNVPPAELHNDKREVEEVQVPITDQVPPAPAPSEVPNTLPWLELQTGTDYDWLTAPSGDVALGTMEPWDALLDDLLCKNFADTAQGGQQLSYGNTETVLGDSVDLYFPDEVPFNGYPFI